MDKDFRTIIIEDKEYYYGEGWKRIYRKIVHNPLYQRGRYIIAARKAGYYSEKQNTVIGRLLFIYYTRKKNVIGEQLHIELGPNKFGRRLRIYHNDIVINKGAIIGDNCELHGNNCIGNKGIGSDSLGAPVVGNGVSFGVGSSAIGKISIANGVKISCLSFVNKSLTEENALYGGVPAKLISNFETYEKIGMCENINNLVMKNESN